MKCILCKIFNYEYWPWYIWHILALPIHIYNSIKCRSITYFTALNPSFGRSGGFVGDYKSEIHKYLPQTYSLKECKVENMHDFNAALNTLNLSLPVVLKPDAGERGEGVEIIKTKDQAVNYFLRGSKYPIVLQEFAEYKNEFGIFVYNHPHRGWQVSGVNTKKPFEVVGDGVSTLLQLISEKCRYRLQIERLEKEKKFNPNIILAKGELRRIEHVLNHRYGAEFINCSDLINDKFSSVILGICGQIPGFNYGRFDIKANSFEEIELHKFKVIELNGAAAEQTVIYDQKKTGLLKSMSIIYNHLAVQGQIASVNIDKGYQPMPFSSFRAIMLGHFNVKESQ